jgi:hypothetical protein
MYMVNKLINKVKIHSSHSSHDSHSSDLPHTAKRPKQPSVRGQFFVSLVVIAVAFGISWMIVGKTNHQVAYVPKSLGECQQAAAKDYQCYAKYYATLSYDQGTAAAFKDMEAAYNTDEYVKSQCHQLAHVVGRTAYEKTGSIEKAYAEGDNFCWSGFYHGAIEQAAKRLGPEKIKQQASTICKSFADKQRYSFNHFNCVHGLGHGLMAVSDYKLPDALKLCDNLKDSWEQSSCYGGVFMENVMVAARGDGTSAYFKADQPLYPCTYVDMRYKEQCYLMQTSYVLQHNGYDFTKTFAECAKADEGYTDTCYRSLGRDASGSTVSDVARTVANCRTVYNSGNTDADTAIYNCMLGADRDFVSYYHGIDKANQLCDAFGGTLTASCRQDVADYYKTF